MTTLWPWVRAWLALLRNLLDRWNPRRQRAQAKRRLEHLLHDAGLSRTQARRITSEYFQHD